MIDGKVFKPISEGIQDGFKEIGFELSERDKKIIHLTTIAAITIVERLMEDSKNDDQG